MSTQKGTKRMWIVVGVILIMAMVLTQLTVSAAGQKHGRFHNDRPQPASFSPNAPDPENVDTYMVSTATNGSVDNGCEGPLNFKKGDVIAYDVEAACWYSWFSAANSGLTNQHNINALHDNCETDDPDVCSIYISFAQNSIVVPDVGIVKGSDIVKAVAIDNVPSLDDYGNYELFFDGSDVGLTTTGEKIDGLYIFDDDQKQGLDDCNTLMLISTAGTYNIPAALTFEGPLKGPGADVLLFCGTNSGSATAGFWSLYHDASAFGNSNVYNVVFEENSNAEIDFGDFEFTTKTDVRLGDIGRVDNSEVIKFYFPNYLGPFFSFSEDAGLDEVVDALHIYYCTDSSDFLCD